MTKPHVKVHSVTYIHLQIPMSEEQHGNKLQDNVILPEEKASDDITVIIACVSEEENGNTESESSFSEECTSDEYDIGNACVYNHTGL